MRQEGNSLRDADEGREDVDESCYINEDGAFV
jgi:hypothetical protein